MAREIERKYLVRGSNWREGSRAVRFRQGYLPSDNSCTVRIRVLDDRAFITIKGNPVGFTRLEYEYGIPITDANELLDKLCIKPLIEKNRYTVFNEGTKWEIDEFVNENQGLVLAEVELVSEEQEFILPDWAGEEVTSDLRYYNVNLAKHPYSQWDENK